VEFRGFVGRERLPEFYRRAYVFCSPVQSERLGIVYLEAMACGRPVVATSLAARQLGERMGAASRKRVEHIFAMDRNIQHVLAVYDKSTEVSRQKLDRSREAAFLTERCPQ